MKRSSRENGFALITVIAVFLVLSMMGLLFIYVIKAKLSSETDRLMAFQSKYLAKSAMQMAMLEMQFKTESIDRVRKNGTQIKVKSLEDFPSSGWIAIGESNPLSQHSYTRNPGNQGITIDPPLQQNTPIGTSVYLFQDLDGDGAIGSIGRRRYGNGTIEASILNREPQNGTPATAIVTSKATVGSAQCKMEAGIFFP